MGTQLRTDCLTASNIIGAEEERKQSNFHTIMPRRTRLLSRSDGLKIKIINEINLI
ncbi:hypothetical protein J4480_02355 [Candidatus Woesearchaeota archaeon]|nr:hypothetical protein [Candidatus Woesearchaeota archaeon]